MTIDVDTTFGVKGSVSSKQSSKQSSEQPSKSKGLAEFLRSHHFLA